jgi:hypothetical protein
MYTFVGDIIVLVSKIDGNTVLLDECGTVLHTNEVMKLVSEVLETYINNDWYEMILKNKKILALYDAGFNLKGKDRYYRSGNPVIKYKEFERPLSGIGHLSVVGAIKKVSNKKEDGYFSIIAFDPNTTQIPKIIIYVLAQNLVLNIYGMTCSKIG